MIYKEQDYSKLTGDTSRSLLDKMLSSSPVKAEDLKKTKRKSRKKAKIEP